jgi:prophage maintenance system killer protein
MNHALIDANKRLGWLRTAVLLEINGVDTTVATNDEAYDFVISNAAGSLEMAVITEACVAAR